MNIRFLCFFFVPFLASFTSIALGYGSSYDHQTLVDHQGGSTKINEQPLAEIAIREAVLDLHENASIKALPYVLGLKVCSYLYAYNLKLHW